MTDPNRPEPSLPAALQAAQLIVHLQGVTQALAAVRRQDEVFSIILNDALEALQGIAGAVSLLQGERLHIAARRGHDYASVWQDRALSDAAPGPDALRTNTPLFFSHGGDLVAAYPQLEAQTGGLAAVASAVLPMVENGQPIGVIVLDFQAPHDFTPDEQHFLLTLAGQCASALDRVWLSGNLERQVQDRTAELEAFVRFTEEAGTETDVLNLAQRAVDVLSVLFPESSSGYYALDEERWKLKVHSDNLQADPVGLAMLKSGVPIDVPVFAEPLRSALPVFVNGWDAREAGLEQAQIYHTIGTYPLFVDGSPRAMFGVALTRTAHWSSQEQGVFRSVGRSLELAIERTEVARQLQQQNTELQGRTQALESFAELTRDLALSSEPLILVERALQVIASLLPSGYGTYWQMNGSTWHLALQVGKVNPPELQQVVKGELPVGQTPVLDRPYQTGEAFFLEQYDAADDLDAMLAGQLLTIATLPVAVGGAVAGIFSVALFEHHVWNVADRAVLQTTTHTLELALERAEQARQLKAQRDMLAEQTRALQASNEELEAFTYSVSHDLRTPVRHILSFMGLLRKSLGVTSVALDAKAGRYLQIIDDAATQLNALIDAMLDLSRTSRQPLQTGLVDLGKLVTAGRAEVEANVAQSQVEWKTGPLLLVTGDSGLLRRVVTILLNNAVKFSRTQTHPVIEIWTEDREHEWAVFVRDNGVGFDPHYQDKLFVVFQRLHRQEEFEGVGVSLAAARRIITRHGGTMFAQGEVGKGATFGFTLPKVAARRVEATPPTD